MQKPSFRRNQFGAQIDTTFNVALEHAVHELQALVAANGGVLPGAALLAGLAEGVWGSLAEISDRWAHDAIFTPAADHAAVDSAYQGWRRAVERAKEWVQP